MDSLQQLPQHPIEADMADPPSLSEVQVIGMKISKAAGLYEILKAGNPDLLRHVQC